MGATENTGEEQAVKHCGRDGCSCEIYEGQTYCGPHCANAAAEVLGDRHCECGHESCRQLPDVPI